MADIIPSLFGLTPELYQQAQSQQADKQALQYAQLTPFQQANFAIGRGAYQLAGALGGEDPELQRISRRNAIARQTDLTDPASMRQGIRALTEANDFVGATQLSNILRDLEYKQAQTFQSLSAGQASLAAAGRERQQATPEKIQLAREFASQAGEPGSPEYNAAYMAQLTRLTTTERPEAMTPEMRNAAALASLKGAPDSPEYKAEYTAQLARLTGRADRNIAVGTDREAVSLEVYNKPFSELTPVERAAVNKRVEAEQGKKAAASAPKFELPGNKALVDIPAFRAKVQATIQPQLQTINATEQAIQSINDSINTNNFVSFNAARTQLARALGDSQLSRRDIEQAGGDPSLLGGLLDVTSKLFTSTPGVDTQKKIQSTLNAIQTVARNRARTEVEQQRKIALRSPGYDPEAVAEALTFPELSAAPVAGGSLAQQAAAELARRRAEKK